MTGAAPGQPIDRGGERPSIGYYGTPVIHQPHWKWLIIPYFFFGGTAGSSSCVAAVVRLFGGARTAEVARTATYVSIAALAPCPILLILDLGRPRRFLNMLRTFHVSSPMSVGTWGLTAFGLLSCLNTLLQLIGDLQQSSPGEKRRRDSEIFPRLSLPFAALGPLFFFSAISSGLAAISAAMALRRLPAEHEEVVLHRLEAGATIAKGAILAAWLFSLGPTAKPLPHGSVGYVVCHAVVGAGMVAPLTISAASRRLPPSRRRAASLFSSALTIAGVFALRYAVVEGGRQSANDPLATFEMTG